MFLLNLNFQGEGQFDANFFFYILFVYGKCLAFQFLSGGIRLYVSIPAGVTNGLSTSWKIGVFLVKNVDFES